MQLAEMTVQTPSKKLLKMVRAHFLLQGRSLRAFCESEGLTRQNVTSALIGKWKGKKASYLIDFVVRSAGLEND